ncbi:MAG: phage portal protein [Ruminococcaceae bacterium]|nr:phage portal protein [Oscillospiraceae bacterium]
MIPIKNAKQAMGVEVLISDKMQSAIEKWQKMYTDDAPWLNSRVKSANIAAAVASELARLSVLEFKSEITGSARADFLNANYAKLLKQLRGAVELMCAHGGVALKPYVTAGGKIAVDIINADSFLPVNYDDSGRITAAVFCDRRTVGKTIYTRLEYHLFENNAEYVQNTCYMTQNPSELGTLCSLAQVDDWAEIMPEAVLEGTEQPLFSYMKMPSANNIDIDSPLGVAAYSRAVSVIEEADKQYSRLLWEFEGGELAIDAEENVFNMSLRADGSTRAEMPKLNERLFRRVPGAAGSADGTFYHVFAPQLRDASILNGYEALLRMIEFLCGLSYGTLSMPQNVDKTAEEIKMSKQRSYQCVSDIQGEVQAALENVIYAMDYWADAAELAPKGEYAASFAFDDSVLGDRQSELEGMRADVAAGLLRPEIYIAKKYGCTEEEAIAMLPQSGIFNE